MPQLELKLCKYCPGSTAEVGCTGACAALPLEQLLSEQTLTIVRDPSAAQKVLEASCCHTLLARLSVSRYSASNKPCLNMLPYLAGQTVGEQVLRQVTHTRIFIHQSQQEMVEQRSSPLHIVLQWSCIQILQNGCDCRELHVHEAGCCLSTVNVCNEHQLCLSKAEPD